MTSVMIFNSFADHLDKVEYDRGLECLPANDFTQILMKGFKKSKRARWHHIEILRESCAHLSAKFILIG